VLFKPLIFHLVFQVLVSVFCLFQSKHRFVYTYERKNISPGKILLSTKTEFLKLVRFSAN